jgi:hypothetical protein
MKIITRGKKFGPPEPIAILLFLFLLIPSLFLLIASNVFATSSLAMPQSSPADQNNSNQDAGAEQPAPKKAKPLGPADDFNRGVPRDSLKGYLKAARDGDFERASQYLDLRYLPGWIDDRAGIQLARELKIALDKVLWFDLEAISAHPDGFSDDGRPSNRDIIGRIETPKKAVDILMHELRSTRLRLLTGHQTTIPNDDMAKIGIENIGLRPHIRRLANIGITYDTPPEKIENAVEIILQILDNHEGMDSEFPPRVYFNEYNPYSLNNMVLYWHHPADYWGYMKFLGQDQSAVHPQRQSAV